jgi:hypothetical protein
MRVAQERIDADNHKLIAKMKADQEASAAKWEREYDQQRQSQAQLVANLQNQIQQLMNRPPQVIHIHHKRRRFLGIF